MSMEVTAMYTDTAGRIPGKGIIYDVFTGRNYVAVKHIYSYGGEDNRKAYRRDI